MPTGGADRVGTESQRQRSTKPRTDDADRAGPNHSVVPVRTLTDGDVSKAQMTRSTQRTVVKSATMESTYDDLFLGHPRNNGGQRQVLLRATGIDLDLTFQDPPILLFVVPHRRERMRRSRHLRAFKSGNMAG